MKTHTQMFKVALFIIRMIQMPINWRTGTIHPYSGLLLHNIKQEHTTDIHNQHQ